MPCEHVRISRTRQWMTGGTLLKSKNCVLDAPVTDTEEKHVLGAGSAG